jgi:phospholipase A1
VFQLGFKTKLVEGAFDKPVDVWFGYTQNSFWQAGNRKASSPFRETNYQPELMVVTPLDFRCLGMQHASSTWAGAPVERPGVDLSRSWNRIYAQVGLERGGWTVLGASGSASTKRRQRRQQSGHRRLHGPRRPERHLPQQRQRLLGPAAP